MRLTAPIYYPAFRCIASACRHSCCIGWEIDIDDDTYALYETMPGELGRRVRDSIDHNGEVPCFRLSEGERCPHLNENGLCEIILGAGEGALAQICDDHPRYRNCFSTHTEIGVGLACEAAAKLVLGETRVVTDIVLEDDGEEENLTPWEREVLDARASLLQIVQDRAQPVELRIEKMKEKISMAGVPSMVIWRSRLSSLERLDPIWDSCLEKLGAEPKNSTVIWDIPLEQFMVYTLHRHLADAIDQTDLRARAAFAVLGYYIMRGMLEYDIAHNISVTLDTISEYARLWSSEIEYSEENIATCFAWLAEEM